MKGDQIDICIREHIYRYEVNNVLVFFSLEDGLIIKTIKGKASFEDLLDIEHILNEIIKLESNGK